MAKTTSTSDPTTALPKRDKRLLYLIAFAGLLTLFAGIVLALYSAVNYKYEDKAQLGESVVFSVPKGSGLSSISDRLENETLIESAFVFKLVTKLRGNEANFKAGEFSVQRGQSMAEIYDILANGRAVEYSVTIPEGLTSAQILRSLDGFPALKDDNPSALAEGVLLPETYNVLKDMPQTALITQMRRAQTALLDEIWDNRAKDLPIKTRAEAIVLASIVEKETGIGAERDKVAGVFVNRLRRGMRLQSDPTIIYGVSKGEPLRNKKGKRRGIFRSEIDTKTAWNTYQIDGLPSTPICNPGADAIRAVLNPADTKALFFVADGTGGHVFGSTLKEHEANVRKWRQIERQKKRERAARKLRQ
ncbi:MAG: endolytic transglycosylase MltG [Litorimonas sp.]